MRYEGLVNYYGLEGLKKYLADREWWEAATRSLRHSRIVQHLKIFNGGVTEGVRSRPDAA